MVYYYVTISLVSYGFKNNIWKHIRRLARDYVLMVQRSFRQIIFKKNYSVRKICNNGGGWFCVYE